MPNYSKKATKLIDELDTSAMHVVAGTIEYADKKTTKAQKALEASAIRHLKARNKLRNYIHRLENKPPVIIEQPAPPCNCDTCIDGRDIAKGC